MSRAGFPFGLTLAVVAALAVLSALGTWQLHRLAWKSDLIARVEALQGAPPRPAGEALAAAARGEDVDFVRVAAECPGLAEAPWLELYGLKDGRAGSRLISACRLGPGPYDVLLVDRGFVADSISARPPADPGSRAPASVTGVLRSPDAASFVSPDNRPAENRWFTRDLPAMAQALGASRPAPVMLFAETSTWPGWQALEPAPLPAEISNRHLEYALTWYGLAGALIAVYAALLWRRWKS